MTKKLWLKNSDIPVLTAFSGNIDADSLLPHIYTAQRTEIKRVLGSKLYNYIDTKIQDGTELTDLYKTIFEDYVVDMLVYFSCSIYMGFGSYKVANSGTYKQGSENAVIVDDKEIQKLSDRYRALAASVEVDFYEYISDKSLPEYANSTDTDDNKVLGWF